MHCSLSMLSAIAILGSVTSATEVNKRQDGLCIDGQIYGPNSQTYDCPGPGQTITFGDSDPVTSISVPTPTSLALPTFSTPSLPGLSSLSFPSLTRTIASATQDPAAAASTTSGCSGTEIHDGEDYLCVGPEGTTTLSGASGAAGASASGSSGADNASGKPRVFAGLAAVCAAVVGGAAVLL